MELMPTYNDESCVKLIFRAQMSKSESYNLFFERKSSKAVHKIGFPCKNSPHKKH
jgi:hypothetical protein